MRLKMRAKNGLCKGDCRFTQNLHKTKAHDEMAEIFRCYKLPVNKVIFRAVILRNLNKIINLRVMYGV